jgi:hypothetical protein
MTDHGISKYMELILNNEIDNYEMFCDDGYYHMWCVRNVNDKRFNSSMSFHFVNKQDAEEFKRLIEIAK